MPFKNEHSARIINPSKFEENSFRSKEIAPGIRIIVGKLKGQNTTSVQTYRFDSKKFSPKQAKEWIKKHNIKNIDFEESTGENMRKANDVIEGKIFDFFRKNPHPKDEKFHKFIESLGKEHSKGEEAVYAIIGDLISGGKSKGKLNKVNPKELEMGIEVEFEHTNNKEIAEKIARDHLAEFPNYYSALLKMEKILEKEKPMKKAFIKIYDNIYIDLQKAKKMPIGTVSKGKKKVAEGKWVLVKPDDNKNKEDEDKKKVKSEKEKPEEFSGDKDSKMEKIKIALKKMANILAEALSGQGVNQPTGESVEQVGENLKQKKKTKKQINPKQKEENEVKLKTKEGVKNGESKKP